MYTFGCVSQGVGIFFALTDIEEKENILMVKFVFIADAW